MEPETIEQQAPTQPEQAEEASPRDPLAISEHGSFDWPLPEGVEPLQQSEAVHTWSWEGSRDDLMSFYAEWVPWAHRQDVDGGVRFRGEGDPPTALYALERAGEADSWRVVVFLRDEIPEPGQPSVELAVDDEGEDFRLRWLDPVPSARRRVDSPAGPSRDDRADSRDLRRYSRLPTSSAPQIPAGMFVPAGAGAAAQSQTAPRARISAPVVRGDGAPVRYFVPTNPAAGF